MHGTVSTTEMQESDMSAVLSAAPCWYALMITAGMERKVCIWLRRRQYQPYWPRYKGPVKLNRHRTANRWRSVIPGYLFLPQPPFEMNWRLIEEDAPGGAGFLRSHGAIVKIPESGKQGIERICEIEAALNASPVAAADGIPFKVGQRVQISKLCLEGVVVRLDKKRKICVETSLFGRVTRITVSAADVEAV